MTVDVTKLRVVARGNHRDGYLGVIEIGFYAGLIPFDCGHRHTETREARDCVRKMVWRLLDDADTTAAPAEGLREAARRWSEFYSDVEVFDGFDERGMVQLDHGHEEYEARIDVMLALRATLEATDD